MSESDAIKAALRASFTKRGMPPDWGVAIAMVECGGPVLSMNQINKTGPDGKRGGSYGPTQISEKTARAHGYTGEMIAFTTDMVLMADWTATIASRGDAHCIVELGTWWNAGRRTLDALSAGSSAVRYVHKLIDFYMEVVWSK